VPARTHVLERTWYADRSMADASPRLARSAGVIGIATMTSRVLGLVREQVLAFYFGAGDAMDAFNVAYRVPNLVRDLFAEGAMSAAFVPTFSKRLASGSRESSWHLANSVINALVLVTGILVMAGIVFAEPLLRVFAGDYAEVPGKFELTTRLTRIMVPFLTLVALAAVFMGMLNSLGHFFLPALSPAMFNVGTIVCALAFIPFAPQLGVEPIVIVAIGTIVGGLGQLLIQAPALAKEGFRYRPTLDFRDQGMHQILLLMVPGTIGLAATQINVFVNTMLATDQGTGAVSWLNYAFRLMYLPIGLFGVSIATAATPAMSRLAHAEDFAQMRSTIAHALGLMMMLNVPATLGLIALASPIIALIFEHGSFTPDDTAATAAALRWDAIGLVGYSVVRIVSPTFYALNKARIPVTVSVVSVFINVALNIALVRVMGYRGLALGTSLAALINAGTQLFLLRRALGGIEGPRVVRSFLKVLAASLAMAAAAWLTDAWITTVLPGASIVMQAVRVATAILVALVVLAGASTLLRVREFEEARDLVLGRLRRMLK
jgi:putative peptidoglycan lipid II flippase